MKIAYYLSIFIPIADVVFAFLAELGYKNELTYIRALYFCGIFLVGIGFYSFNNIKFKIYKYIVIYYLLVFIYSYYSYYMNNNLKTIIFSAGTLIIPMALFAIGFSKLKKLNSIEFIFDILLILSSISALFGIWEANNTEFWLTTIEYPIYLQDVKSISLGLEPSTGLPWNFFKTEDPEDGRRSAGLLAAPLAQAMVLSFGLVGSFAYFILSKKPIYLIITLLIGYGLYSTGSRGPAVVAIIAMFGIIYSNNYFIRNKILKLFILICGSYLIYILYGEKIHNTINFLDGSTVGHWDALVLNIKDFTKIIFGQVGVGFHGANATNDQTQIMGGGEGAIFSIAYQIGIFGSLIFLYFYFSILKDIYSIRFLKLSKKIICISYVTLWIGIGLTATFITSEHILTLSGMSFFWMICGGLVSLSQSSKFKYLRNS